MSRKSHAASLSRTGSKLQIPQLSPKQKLQILIDKMVEEKDEKHVQNVISFYHTQVGWQKLIENTLTNMIKKNKFSVFLHWLCYLNESALFHKLWLRNPEYGIKDSFDHTELYYAVGSNAIEIVKYILEKDIDYVKEEEMGVHDLELYATGENMKSPLKLASEKTSPTIFNLMKEYEIRLLFDNHRSFISIPRIQGNQNTFTGTQQSFQMDWKDVINSDPDYSWLTHPTGQLVYVDQVGTHIGMCSGFNIGNNYFLTAGHCLLNQSLQMVCNNLTSISLHSYKVSFNYQYHSKSLPDEKYRTIQENLYAITEVADWGKCHGVDYAVFTLEPSAEKFFGKVELSIDIPPYQRQVGIAHHPRGLPKKLSLGQISQPILDTDSDLKHSAHTLKGSSGSPIADMKTEKVIAVHVAGVEEKQTATSHIGLLVREIAKVSKKVDAIGKFGLFKKQKKSPILPPSPFPSGGTPAPYTQGYY